MPNLFRQWPKAELHLHLEGSIEPATLLEIDPTLDLQRIDAAYRYADFPGFLKTYGWICKRLSRPEHYALATRHLLETLADQNVSYAEITLSAGVVLWKGEDFAPIYEAVQHEAVRSRVQVRWIIDIVRQFPMEDAWRLAPSCERCPARSHFSGCCEPTEGCRSSAVSSSVYGVQQGPRFRSSTQSERQRLLANVRQH